MTTRENLLFETHEWVRHNVPKHTRAQYEALLATNTDLALELIAKWRDLEELRERYHALQVSAGKRVAPLPPFIVSAEVNRDEIRNQMVSSVRWQIDPYRVNFAVGDVRQLREAPHTLVEAYEAYFHARAVPALWDATQATLWPALTGSERA